MCVIWGPQRGVISSRSPPALTEHEMSTVLSPGIFCDFRSRIFVARYSDHACMNLLEHLRPERHAPAAFRLTIGSARGVDYEPTTSLRICVQREKMNEVDAEP
jgi:hypothetical protein